MVDFQDVYIRFNLEAKKEAKMRYFGYFPY